MHFLLRKRLIFCLFLTGLLLLLLSLQNLTSSADEQKLQDSAFRLKVMSYNIKSDLTDDKPPENEWDVEKFFFFTFLNSHASSFDRKTRVLSLLERYNADFVLMQEVELHQGSYLARNLPQYEYIMAGREANGGGESLGILYNHLNYALVAEGQFWLSETPSEPGSVMPGAALPRVVKWGVFKIKKAKDLKVVVASVHFDHRSNSDARNKEVKAFISEFEKIVKQQNLSEPPYIIVAGDFNLFEYEAPIQSIKGNEKFPFTDSIDCIERKQGQMYGTFNGWALNSDTRIDYIFVTKNIQPVSHEIIRDTFSGLLPSDHFPLMAGLKIAE